MQIPDLLKTEAFWKKVLFYIFVWIAGFELKFFYHCRILSDYDILTYTFGFWLFGTLLILPAGTIFYLMKEKLESKYKVRIDDDLFLYYTPLSVVLTLFVLAVLIHL